MGPTRVPRRIYFVDELPLTESGKVRRAELPRLLGLERLAVSNRETRDETTGAIMSPLEAALSGLWMTVLQVKCAGPNDNFFLLAALRGFDPEISRLRGVASR